MDRKSKTTTPKELNVLCQGYAMKFNQRIDILDYEVPRNLLGLVENICEQFFESLTNR
jgi:hypothetical protein